ncbi:IolC protein, partial [Cutibacterium acnes]
MTPVALPDIADLDRAVDDLTDALIATTDAAETSTDGSWYIESAIEELRTALTEVASLSRAAGA